MRIFITGGTGFIGRTLTRALSGRGHEISLLTRDARRRLDLAPAVSLVEGDPTSVGSWQEVAARHPVVINLAGASIFGRWTARVKQEIRESRILTTRHLVSAMAGGDGAGKRLLSASAVGYYGYRGDESLGEDASPGGDFLASLAVQWEAEATRARDLGAGVTLCRFGIVLGREGGMLPRLVPLFHCFLGTTLGSGDQWMSWIHEEDLVRIILYLLDYPELEGAVNCTAPHPARNREMTRALAGVLNVPAFLPPVPGFALRWLLGEFGGVLLKGQRVVPARLLGQGFAFRFPTLREALEDLCGEGRWRRSRSE